MEMNNLVASQCLIDEDLSPNLGMNEISARQYFL